MYGGTPLYDGISQFTFGHSADGTKVDDIFERLPLFKYYIKKTLELLKLMGYGFKLSTSGKVERINIDKQAEDIFSILDNAYTIALEKNDKSFKLDGVLALYIHLLRIERDGEKVKSFTIPIKHLSNQSLNSSAATSLFYRIKSDYVKNQLDGNNRKDFESPMKAIRFLMMYSSQAKDIVEKLEGIEISYEVTHYTFTPIFKK